MSKELKRIIEVPKWVCALAIVLGSAALVVQCAIDIYQGTRTTTDWASWFAQVWQMALPTGFTLVFAAIGGCLLYARRWGTAIILYGLVFFYMAFTASNSMDFVTNQTVAKTEAEKARQMAAKDIAGIQNEIALKERNERNENLWRTYTVAKTPADKEKVLAQIKASNEEPVNLQAPGVEVVQVGSGAIFSRWGWRAEVVQEAKAIALPIGIMIGKALGITLGFALWPQAQPNSVWPTGDKPKKRLGLAPVSPKEARADLLKLMEEGVQIPNQKWLAKRWRCSEPTVSDRLTEWKVQRQRAGVGQGNKILPFHANGHAKGLSS